MEKYEVYNGATEEKICTFDSQEYLLEFMSMIFDSFMIDSIKVVRIREDIEQASVEEQPWTDIYVAIAEWQVVKDLYLTRL